MSKTETIIFIEKQIEEKTKAIVKLKKKPLEKRG